MDFTPAARGRRRMAAVDLGSNCFHVLIADGLPGGWQPVLRRRYRVGLASGLNDGGLVAAVQRRAEATLVQIAELLRAHACDHAAVVGTCAMRQLQRGHELATRVERVLGAPLRVISGDEEARLIYLGALQTLPRSLAAPRLIIDIGGGSTELAWGCGDSAERCVSLPLGCVGISAAGLAGHQGSSSDIMARCLAAARSVLATPALDAFVQDCPAEVIGTSGSIESICSVIAAHEQTPLDRIAAGQLEQLHDCLTRQPRLPAGLPGLETEREHLFPGSVAILLALQERLGFQSLCWAEGALQDGLLCEAFSACR